MVGGGGCWWTCLIHDHSLTPALPLGWLCRKKKGRGGVMEYRRVYMHQYGLMGKAVMRCRGWCVLEVSSCIHGMDLPPVHQTNRQTISYEQTGKKWTNGYAYRQTNKQMEDLHFSCQLQSYLFFLRCFFKIILASLSPRGCSVFRWKALYDSLLSWSFGSQ